VNTSITTCRTSPASWNDIVESESQRIFGHMMGNDPRPHYFHQSNLAESDTPEGAVFYPVLDATIAEYDTYFNSTEPIQQLSPTQIGELLAHQEAWATASTSTITGYIEGIRAVIINNGTATTAVPLSGTEAGTLYGGTRSGWINTARGRTSHTAAHPWPAAPPAPPPTPPAAPSLLAGATTAVQRIDVLTGG
jgi:hypothetical protein